MEVGPMQIKAKLIQAYHEMLMQSYGSKAGLAGDIFVRPLKTMLQSKKMPAMERPVSEHGRQEVAGARAENKQQA